MHDKKNKISLLEIITPLVIVFVLISIYPALYQKSEHCSHLCRPNLSQIGKGLNLYLLDFGKQVSYPKKSGQGFLLSLYKNNILTDVNVYLCGNANDKNNAWELSNEFDNGDEDGPVSYAGRKNENQSIYPGIFKPTEETTTTPIVSDDIGYPDNHENGTIMNFLFLDGHVDCVKQNDRDFNDLFDVLSN